MAILRAVELMMGVFLLMLAAVMFRWWLETDDPEVHLVQIALYALLGITIIENNWR